MLAEYFQQFQLFSAQEIQELLPLFESRVLRKNDFFVREGEVNTEVAFISEGIFRSFYTSARGDEHTYCFRFPNDLMAAYSSFITRKASVESMQALTLGRLFVIQKETIDHLVKKSPNWMHFLKVMAEQQYLELEQRIFQLQKDSATQRYQDLLTNQPEYIQQIPLHYLASYLGITQRHLSRIRKEVSI